MKRKNLITIIATSAIALIFVFLTTDSYTKILQAPTIATGAPSENTCGKSGCHNTTPNSFTGTLDVSFNQPFYKPDSTYVVTVSTNETGMTRFGFSSTVLDGSDVKQGTWSLSNVINTSLQTAANNRAYVGHKSANTTNSWTFNWKAPSTNVGDVTIYVASICGNANNSSSGDHCYTTSLVFQPNPFSVVSELTNDKNSLLVQNPVTDKLFVSFRSSLSANTKIQLFDMNGKMVSVLMNEEQAAGTHAKTFEKPTTPGMYFIDYSSGNNHEVKKVIVL